MTRKDGLVTAIVFDLDDTLYPEVAFIRSGFDEVARKVSPLSGARPETIVAEFWAIHDSGVRGSVFNIWLGNRKLPFKLKDWMVDIYRTHTPVIEPYEDVIPVLRELGKEFKLGLLSDGIMAVQARKVKALGLEEYFDVVVFTDAWGREAWKPAPRGFLEVLRMLSVVPAEAVYVADNPDKDFVGARRSGMNGIRIRRPAGIYSKMEPKDPGQRPNLEISSLLELAGSISTNEFKTNMIATD